MPDKLSLIDTNILVYAYDISDPRKHKIASDLLLKCWAGEVSYALSIQNLNEFYMVVTKKIERPLEKNVARRIIEQIIAFNHWIKCEVAAQSILGAIDLTHEHQVAYWDALIAATMLNHHIQQIYTENVKDFSKINEITVINPFK